MTRPQREQFPERGEGDEAELRTLVTAALAGDRVAVGRLLHAVQRIVAPYCKRRLAGVPGSPVEDVLQEIGIAVLEALPRIRTDRAVRPYLFAVARNKVVDAYRTRPPDLPMNLLPDRADPAPGPAEILIQRDRSAFAHRMIARLGERERDVLTLRLIGQLSSAETAAILGMSEGAVRVAQHRALQRLRGMLTRPA